MLRLNIVRRDVRLRRSGGRYIKLRFILALCALSCPASGYAETLNNEAILNLLNAGLGDDVVIAKIKTTIAGFDLSTAQVIALKQKGVSGPVLAAMISASVVVAMSIDSPDPLVPHPSGIYLWGPTKMTRIESTITRQARNFRDAWIYADVRTQRNEGQGGYQRA